MIENIRFMGSMYGSGGEELDRLATETLSFTNLLPFKDRLADHLSGGMKQKLALSASLMHTPELFILDEPTTGVDPVSRREFWQMLYRLNKQGMTIFVSTPYMDEAELCHRVAFMDGGQIVSCDSPKKLKEQYPYQILSLLANTKDVKRFLTGCPVLDVNAFGDRYHLTVHDPEAAIASVRHSLDTAGVQIESLTQIQPTLEDVFVYMASRGEHR